MKIKTFVLFSLLFVALSSQGAFAFDDVFDDYVFSGDSFEIGDDLFKVALSNNEETLVLRKNNFEVFYIDIYDCEETDFFMYCFENLTLDYEDHGRRIPGSMEWEPDIHLIIYDKTPEIKITRTAEKEINRDDRTKVTITIENKEDLRINNLVFTDVIPSNAELVVANLPEFSSNGNVFTWSYPILKSEDETQFFYTLIPKSYEDILLDNGSLSFTYSSNSYSEIAPKKTIKLNQPFKITSKMSDDEVGLSEEFTYDFKIENQDWENALNVDFSLEVPSNVELTKFPPFISRKDNLLTYDEKLSIGEAESFTIKFKSRYEDSYVFRPKTSISIRDEVFEEAEEHVVNVSLPKLDVDLKVSREDVFENNYYTVFVYLDNPNQINYYDISGKLYSTGNLFKTVDIDLSAFGAGDNRKLVEKQVLAIPVEERTDFNITLKGQYRTDQFQFFNFEDVKTLTVNPVGIGFKIVKSANSKEIYQGGETSIRVSAKNQGQKVATLKLSESIPPPFEIVGGSTEKVLTLGIDKQDEFYLYKIRAPVNTTPGDYTFRTKLDYENGTVVQFEELKLKVLKNESLAQDDSDDDSDAYEVVEPEKEKENKSFFRKVIDFFAGLF